MISEASKRWEPFHHQKRRITMTPRLAISVLALAGLVLVACGSDESTDASDAVDAGDVPTAAQLDNRKFVSTDVEGYELVDGTEITLGFEVNGIAAQAGCNTLTGSFQLDENALSVGTMGMTMMACDEALMDQDTWLSEFLSSLPYIALDDNTLRLSNDDVTITLLDVSEANPDIEVEGTTWVVTGTVATQAISSVPADSMATLTITDGTAAVNTGCNTGSGTVEVTDTTMTFGPLATTRMACPDDVMALETSVVSVLDGEVTYEISGVTMSIRKGVGVDAIGLELSAES
jgi:heat shock protein HslJ